MTHPLRSVMMIVFGLSILAGVLGNFFVYLALVRRGVPVRHLWAGTPGYMYRVCVRNESVIGVPIRRMAFGSHIALVLSFVLVFPLYIFHVTE
jgi:hypothetical protein